MRQNVSLTGFDDATVDRRLHELIEQEADPGVAANAIKEYNRLKKRISDKPFGDDFAGDISINIVKKYSGPAPAPGSDAAPCDASTSTAPDAAPVTNNKHKDAGS